MNKIYKSKSSEYDFKKLDLIEKELERIIIDSTTSTFDLLKALMDVDKNIISAYERVAFVDSDISRIRIPCFYLCDKLKQNTYSDLYIVTAKSNGFTTEEGEKDIGESHSMLVLNADKAYAFDPGIRFPKKILLKDDNIVNYKNSTIKVSEKNDIDYPMQYDFIRGNTTINYQFNPNMETIDIPEIIFKKVIKYFFAYKMQNSGKNLKILYNVLNNEISFDMKNVQLSDVVKSKTVYQELYNYYKLFDEDDNYFMELLKYINDNREYLLNDIMDKNAKARALIKK